VEKVVWIEGGFGSGKLLKIFIIVVIKDNNQIIAFLFFYFLHAAIPFMPPPTR
jgi:hypothetical protein